MNYLRVTHRMFPLKPYFCALTSQYFAFTMFEDRFAVCKRNNTRDSIFKTVDKLQ